ncbi:MAG: aminotransferase class I/II [Chloroflexi bacterium]|nr:MAG: aminotransferase class I/II [Chloroflexota bacterium]
MSYERFTIPRLTHQAQNPMFRIGALVHGREDILHLEFGEPDFPTPAHIVEAAAKSLRDEKQGYGPSNGLAPLREAIAARVTRVSKSLATPDQIIVTPGGTGALMASLLCLTLPGDEVLVPDPAWAGYEGMLAVASAQMMRYPLRAADGWQPDLEALEAAITPRTRVLLLNSPSNPAGAVYPEATIASVVEIADRHDLWILSDECYDELVYEGRHISPASLDQNQRVITIGTFSKTYAMTGWRVGWLVAPPALLNGLNIIVAAQVNNLPTFVQRGALAALRGSQQCAREMLGAYRDRRDLAITVLRSHGVLSYLPAGAFYLLIDLVQGSDSDAAPPASPNFDSVRFAESLIAERGIAVAPGAAFGSRTNGSVRVSLASGPDTLRKGISGLLELARGYPGTAV